MMQHFVELGHCMAVRKDTITPLKRKPLSFIFTQSFANYSRHHFQCYILHTVCDQNEAKVYHKATDSAGVMSDWIIPLVLNTSECDQSTSSLFDYAQVMLLSDQLAYVDILYFAANVLVELDEWALQQLFTLCTRIKVNGGRICFYYQYQPDAWIDADRMTTAVQLLEPLMDSVFYDAQSFAELTRMDAQSCLAYLRNCLIHDIIIKLSDHRLLVADACIEAFVDASNFYKSAMPENDEILFGKYMAIRAQGVTPGVALAGVLDFELKSDAQLAQCNPYRSKSR